MRPPCTTQIRSARCTVESLCATMTTVISCCAIRLSIAACTRASLSASSALVASSSSRTFGLRTSARAMETRCFWPPESCTPRSPTSVSYPSGIAQTKWCAFARRAALSTSSPGSAGPAPGLRTRAGWSSSSP
mmetsp:Transcript_56277/g.164486  ORF Transcript_56277/g.164486 Transcript_56277/m.164486 type:complete len:133 (-) Transcript_56277:1417-1815(-)